MGEERIRIEAPGGPVSAAWCFPQGPTMALVVVAHGAGTGMDSLVLTGFADCLRDANIASLRFNFPYMEAGRKTPDRAPAAVAAWNAVFDVARERAGGRRVFASGKSFGGRMASMAVAEGMAAAGLVFLGYPLHAPGRTEQLRDAHLESIHVPMLFLQGTEDVFARYDLVLELTRRLGRWAVLHPVEGGDHSFRVRGRKLPDGEIGRLLGSVAARFINSAQV